MNLADAADTAGVSPRTVRGWVARGEGHDPTRPATPKLRRFAVELRKARGQPRAVAQSDLFATDRRLWLARSDRSGPGDGDRQDHPQGPAGGPLGTHVRAMTEDEIDSALHRMFEMARAHLSRSDRSPKARRKAS